MMKDAEPPSAASGRRNAGGEGAAVEKSRAKATAFFGHRKSD